MDDVVSMVTSLSPELVVGICGMLIAFFVAVTVSCALDTWE